MKNKPPVPEPDQISEIPRRGMLTKALALLIGTVAGVVPLVAGAVFFFDPLTRRKKSVGATGAAVDPDGFIRVGSVDALADDGSPRSFKVVADLQDFWNKFPDSEIGSVFLRRDEGGNITCFNARCPHLGCTVGFDAGRTAYVCPCHESAFDLAGRRTNNVPPRDLDPLESRVDNDGMIWVKFQKFRAGIKEREAM